MGLVSVVVPAYNAGPFIGEALESIVRQTYRDIEVLVIDDGSSDDTAQRVAAFGPSVRYIAQQNAGPAAARNNGIQQSRGEYIAFLDADDAWLPRKVERQVAMFEARPDLDVGYTWWTWMDDAGRPLPEVKSASHEGDVLEELLRGCFILPTMLMLRRRGIERVGLLDTRLRLSDDWDLLLRLAGAGSSVGCVQEVLARKRAHPGLSGDVDRVIQDSLIALERAFAALPPGPRSDGLRDTALRNLHVQIACQLVRTGRLDEGVRRLAQGVAWQPYVLTRPAFYWGLAYGLLPSGLATRTELVRRRRAVEGALADMLRGLFASPDLPPAVAGRERAAHSTLLLVCAALDGLGRDGPGALGGVARAVRLHPAVSAELCGRAAWKVVRGALRRCGSLIPSAPPARRERSVRS